ncbi:MAG TPA: condensation domain-containing protein, partial [Anaeromyxobacter sp.]
MPLTRPPGPSVRPEGGSLPESSGATGTPPGAPPGREATPLEQAMLVRALREPEAGVDVEQIVAELPDAPDPGSIERGFRRAVERWPSLTGFLRWEGLPAPRRETLPAGPVPFERHDWRALGKGEREERFLAWLRADRRRAFRLDRPPLLRVALFDMGEGLRMVWTFHHLIADGRSFEPVLAEVLRAAPDLAFENAPVLESRAPFPSDGAREFWASRLAGFEGPTPLALTRDSAAREEPSEPGETVRRLSARSSAALAALAARPRLSASAVVAGAWAILLARTSGEDDVVFGSVSSGRRREDAGKVGLFIRTLPTRARVPRKGAVLPWLEELRTEQLEARAHEAVSLPEISSWLGRPGDVPLFETLVVFDREPLGTGLARRGGVWERRSFRLVEKTGEAVTVYATAEPEWVVRLAWDRSRFDAAGGDRMADALVRILETIASEGEAADFSRLSLASPEERRRVLFEWNATDVDVPEADARGAGAAIEEQARRTPERTAVVCGDERVSYAELDARVGRVAGALAAAGVV